MVSIHLSAIFIDWLVLCVTQVEVVDTCKFTSLSYIPSMTSSTLALPLNFWVVPDYNLLLQLKQNKWVYRKYVSFIHLRVDMYWLRVQAGQNSAFDQQLFSIYNINKDKPGTLFHWKRWLHSPPVNLRELQKCCVKERSMNIELLHVKPNSKISLKLN